MTSSQSRQLAARIERWPIAGSFTISRGAKTEAVTVVAEVSQGGHTGRGECVPYPRYGETPEATLAALRRCRNRCAAGWTGRPCRPRCPQARPATRWIARFGPRGQERRPAGLGPARPAGATRPAPPPSRSRWERRRRWRRRPPRPRTGRCSRSSSAATAMATRIAAVRKAAPESELIVDANEAWTAGQSRAEPAACADCRRDPGRAAAAGRPGRGAGADQAAGRGLRRRKRARPRLARGPCASATTPSTSSSTRPAG